MKLPGVSGVYDYAGPSRNLRCRSRPCCLPPMQKRQRPDCIFSELNTQPTCTPVYASPNTSRCATQNSGPSGSLLLSRRTLSFPASCRFIPAHCIGDLALVVNIELPTDEMIVSRKSRRIFIGSNRKPSCFRMGNTEKPSVIFSVTHRRTMIQPRSTTRAGLVQPESASSGS
jgi:hypothetical protein